MSFFALRLPTGVGTFGGDVNSAIISRLTGMSVASAYSFFSLSIHAVNDRVNINAIRIYGIIIGFCFTFMVTWFNYGIYKKDFFIFYYFSKLIVNTILKHDFCQVLKIFLFSFQSNS